MATADVDLTVAGGSGTIEGAVFTTEQIQPAGTGVFNTFLEIQHTGTEQGYNTDAAPQFDEKSSATHNHSILLADIPIVIGDGSNGTIEGLAYREFLFDATGGGTNRFLSLDRLQIFQGSGSLTNYTGSGFAGADLVYDLDAGADRWIALNSGLSSGSGSSDIRILIPDSYFINDAEHRYVTLYSAFGLQGGMWSSGANAEQWGLNSETAGSGNTSAFVVTKSAPSRFRRSMPTTTGSMMATRISTAA
jgi:hypothetical protein